MSTAPSRPLIAALQVTLDGYAFGPENEWVDSWADALELLPPVDAFILGGGMYPGYEAFWTAILHDPAAAAEMLGREPYPREIAYAQVAAKTPHLVLSTTLHDAAWPTARLARHVDEVADLKQQPGNAAYVVGGPRLVGSLIAAGHVDELHLIMHPVAAGAGQPLFDGMDREQAFELVSAEPLAAGRAHLTYRAGKGDA